MGKEPLYPHQPQKQVSRQAREVSKISERDGKIVRQDVFKLEDIDATLRSYFNIGAKKIVIYYDNLKVEWAIVPE